MAKFAKGPTGPETEEYVIGLNIVLRGSKKLTDEEKEALLSTDAVRLTITDANDESRVLADETLSAKEFSTGNIGFGLNVRGVQFG